MNTTKRLLAGIILVPATLLIIAATLSSGKTPSGDELKKENRTVESFTSIGFSVAGNLYYTQDNACKLSLEGPASDLEKIITEVKDGKLKIYTKSMFNGTMRDVKIYVSSPSLEALGLAGSGDALAEGPVKTDALDLALSGSGNITFRNLSAKKVKAAIAGSGDINVAGNSDAEEISLAISGSGDIDFGQFNALNGEVAIAGSGDCKVKSSGNLKCRISGSGNISYSGDPKLDAKVSGSGKISRN